MTESEEREIKLEAIIQNMYDGYEKARDVLPFTNEKLSLIDEIMTEFYNQAEIRSDIGDYVSVKIEFEDEL